jgi:hypothetical protein
MKEGAYASLKLPLAALSVALKPLLVNGCLVCMMQWRHMRDIRQKIVCGNSAHRIRNQ